MFRGSELENLINITNDVYRNCQIALVQKIPTPLTPMRRGGKIKGAFYSIKSTVDYIGVFRGTAICFDAKETNDQHKLPLKNIEPHQVEFMADFNRAGGKSFLIVNFTMYKEYYLVKLELLTHYYSLYLENKDQGKRGYSSIPYEVIKKHCSLITAYKGIPLDYLKYI